MSTAKSGVSVVEFWITADRLARGVLRRRKRLALVSGLLMLLLLLPAAYYLSKEPPRYKTSAVVLLEARPDRVPVFQEFSPYRALPVQMAILKSRSLAETVVESLPAASLQELLNTHRVDYWQALINLYARWRGIVPEPISPQRRALAELQHAVTFAARPDSSGLVNISAEASRPNLAVDILNAYIEALVARTRTFNIDDARVSREFLEQQLADVKRSLQTSEQSLQSFVTAHGGIRVPERSSLDAAQLARTESELAEIQTSRKMLHARLEALREKVDVQKRSQELRPSAAAAPPARVVSAEVQRLRTQLVQLESSLLELRTRYTQEHPRVRLVVDRIDEIRRQLGDAVKDTVSTTPATAAVPPAERVNFADQLVALEAAYHSMTAREEALRKRAEDARQNLKGLSGGELEYARLSREVASQRSLYALLSEKLTGARIREQGEMRVVKVVDPPSYPIPSVNQKPMQAAVLAVALALLAGIGVPAAVEWFHRKIENEDDVELAAGLPVLAVVPRVRVGAPMINNVLSENGRGPSEQLMFTEAFQSLRVAIELGTRGERLRSLLVTSAFAHEGKSTVVINLGMALNEAGRRVVVADTDFLRPSLHRAMKVKSAKGLVDTLQAEQPLDQALALISEGLWLAQRGDTFQSRSRAMLAGSRLRELIGEMRDRADFVICDSSPVLLIPDNLLLASSVDAVVLVAKAGSTGFRDLARTKVLLEGAGARILGVVLNGVPSAGLRNYYRRYYESYVKKVKK
jgi:capsular exopolysaccharide synthesis family protein